MTEVGKERAALQRGAAIHLNDALAKTKGYVLSGEKLKAARTETQGWLDGVDDAMLAFSQFQLSLNEVRNSSHVGDQWSTAEWEVVAARLDVVSRSDYGKETPDERMRRERRRELLEGHLPACLANPMREDLRRHVYIEAPTEWTPGRRNPYDPGWDGVFLAGGITGCPDWQTEMRDLLWDAGLVIINPRRPDFPIGDPTAAPMQIEWEHRHLRRADRILFWFSAATLNPIVLYELGTWSMTTKPIAIGIEPGYAREQDVRIQTKLVRPDVEIVSTLPELAKAIRRAKSSGYTPDRVPPNERAPHLLDEIIQHGDANGALANATGDELRDALALGAERIRELVRRWPRGQPRPLR